MASNREERRLQRLRGAQSHQVGDLDFGIQIPSAAAPRPALPQIPSSKRTPASRGRGRRSRSNSAPPRATPPPPLSTRSNNANTSAKLRKLDDSADPNMPSSSSRSTQSSGKKNVYDIVEEDEEDEAPVSTRQKTARKRVEVVDELAGEEVSGVRTPKPKQARGKATPLAVEEITESPRNAPGSGQRKRLEPGQAQAQILSSLLQGAVAEATPVTQPRKNRRSGIEVQDDPLNESTQVLGSSKTQRSSNGDDLDELSPEQPSKHTEAERFSDVEEEEEEQEDADDVEELVAATRLRRKRKRKSIVATENIELEPEDDDELAERTPKPTRGRKARPKSSPAVQRQPKQPKSMATDGKRKPRDGIPIAVQRLTKPIKYGEDESDEDILNADIPYAKQGGVNAVDVLAQVGEEVLTSILSTLEEGGSKAQDSKTRREYRTKLRAIEAFQEELRMTLFELTTMLDAENGLSKRVRDAQKEKIRLRQDLLRIRSEREHVALQMDEVRIKHETRSTEAQERQALNTNLQDMELAVSIAIDNGLGTEEGEVELAPPDLEIDLKMVVTELSSKSAGGGLLKRMREFNDFLERTALALEGRS